jgi:hypothetical protein
MASPLTGNTVQQDFFDTRQNMNVSIHSFSTWDFLKNTIHLGDLLKVVEFPTEVICVAATLLDN